MKRILLILILLFPIVTLALYVFMVMSRSHHAAQPPAAQSGSRPSLK